MRRIQEQARCVRADKCGLFLRMRAPEDEGNGLRPETAAACRERLTIPMRGRAESLNAAAAAAILTWAMADGAVETEGAR